MNKTFSITWVFLSRRFPATLLAAQILSLSHKFLCFYSNHKRLWVCLLASRLCLTVVYYESRKRAWRSKVVFVCVCVCVWKCMWSTYWLRRALPFEYACLVDHCEVVMRGSHWAYSYVTRQLCSLLCNIMNAVGVISFFLRQEFHSIKRFGLLWKQAYS